MNILLVWATNSGTTQMVADMIANGLTTAGHTVTQKEVRNATADDFTSPDVILLGSPSWDFDGKEGMPHEDYAPFMKLFEGKTFENKKFAVFGLGDMSYKFFCGAVTHLEEFVGTLKGTLVVPSLKIDNYYSDANGNNTKITAWAASLAQALSKT